MSVGELLGNDSIDNYQMTGLASGLSAINCENINDTPMLLKKLENKAN